MFVGIMNHSRLFWTSLSPSTMRKKKLGKISLECSCISFCLHCPLVKIDGGMHVAPFHHDVAQLEQEIRYSPQPIGLLPGLALHRPILHLLQWTLVGKALLLALLGGRHRKSLQYIDHLHIKEKPRKRKVSVASKNVYMLK